MSASAHRAFSFRRIAAITGNTLTELTRLKVFYVLLLFALVLIGNSIFMAQFTFQQEFQVLKDIGLGAMSLFTSLLAIVATARLLPQDVPIHGIDKDTPVEIANEPLPFGRFGGASQSAEYIACFQQNNLRNKQGRGKLAHSPFNYCVTSFRDLLGALGWLEIDRLEPIRIGKDVHRFARRTSSLT